eukprot:4691468-Heterocapsa_arctica.AAC.1
MKETNSCEDNLRRMYIEVKIRSSCSRRGIVHVQLRQTRPRLLWQLLSLAPSLVQGQSSGLPSGLRRFRMALASRARTSFWRA